jgi:hypothetical protein
LHTHNLIQQHEIALKKRLEKQRKAENERIQKKAEEAESNRLAAAQVEKALMLKKEKEVKEKQVQLDKWKEQINAKLILEEEKTKALKEEAKSVLSKAIKDRLSKQELIEKWKIEHLDEELKEEEELKINQVKERLKIKLKQNVRFKFYFFTHLEYAYLT